MEKDLDELILQEIENEFKTVKRIHEDLLLRGIETQSSRIQVRLKSFRRFNMIEFKTLDFPIEGPKPLAYKKKEVI